MDFGLQSFPGAEGAGARRSEVYRDVLDRLPSEFTTVWVADHLQFGMQDQMEAWTLLSFLAGACPRYRYGHLVLAQGFRNPALVAKMAASLAELTAGRFILGIGAGWHEEEYRAYGYRYPSAKDRVEQLGDAIRLIRALWTDAPANYQGSYYSIQDAYCEPRPRAPIPILVGAGGRLGLRLAAELADMWNWDGPLDPPYRPRLEALREACAEVGRPISEITLTAGVEVSMPEDIRSFEGSITIPSGDTVYRLGPTAADVIREIRLLEAEGVAHIQIAFDTPRSLNAFVDEVVPIFGSPTLGPN
jgi:alkanesulfonate monooxygenase SsuD/methylene tetrahydromethanopterin reductase-like flavin-dependent oxidoreductase (luciferase family)